MCQSKTDMVGLCMLAEAGVERIRALNDRARQSFTGCRVAVTVGIAALGHDAVYAVFDLVKAYDNFTPDNDPYGDHDFGSLYRGEYQVFWKFDYYDLDYTMHSPDPADDTVTARVLTVMLAEEY
jgi:hypothetical protein